MPNDIDFEGTNFKIAKRKVEVKYDFVDETVDEIWSQNPDLVVHVGVHGMANRIHLEKCAINGFDKPDYALKMLSDPTVCLKNSGSCKILETKLNVDKITAHLNKHYNPMFIASCDVGSYLCGYIYLKTLDRGSDKALFVHVPRINTPYTTEEMSHALLKVIEECLSEIFIKIDKK